MRGREVQVVQSMDNMRHLQSQLSIELVDGIYAVVTVGALLEGSLDTRGGRSGQEMGQMGADKRVPIGRWWWYKVKKEWFTI